MRDIPLSFHKADMIQIAADHLQHNVRFALGRVGNSWFITLAGRDIAKREVAAAHIVDTVFAQFQDLMIFDVHGSPLSPSQVAPVLRGAVLALGPLTHNAARSGHQDPRRDARNLIADWIIDQLEPFEILIGEPGGNIFGDRVGQRPGALP